ncbi:MAG: hypothetical protein CM1200mP39_12030 [Dehalococcoidia bacterium]|nr:MAG: hypothetical protein CM1200mP39_12030 [Dehalococcoidia bacterium]
MGAEQRQIPLAHAYFAGIDPKKDVLFRIVRTPEGTLFLIRPGNLMVEGLMFER